MAKKKSAEIEPVAIQGNELVANCDHPLTVKQIEKMIFTIRGVQVMVDSDLATLYGIETRALNQAVKRNIERFPDDFMFQLSMDEAKKVKSQFVTLDNGDNPSRSQNVTLVPTTNSSRSQFATLITARGQNIKYRPYVFTENGIAMLSSVLRSQTAIEVNIRIMRAFTAMRHFLASNAQVFQRLEVIEHHQLELAAHQAKTDHRIEIEEVFQLLEAGQQPQQGIFFDGQVFDAYNFVNDLIRSAKKSIVLFDNYVDDTVLAMLDKRQEKVSATIYTQKIKQQLSIDLAKHNAQYQPIEVKTFDKVHDRFLCIDNTVYHIGASLKDLGKKWFAFSKMEMKTKELMANMK